MVSTANAEQHRTLLLQAHGLLCMAWRVASVAGGSSRRFSACASKCARADDTESH